LTVDTTLTRWEYGEYASAAIVIAGVVGEFLADFSNVCCIRDIPEHKDKLGKLATLVLIAGLAAELVCLVNTNVLSGRIIAFLGKQAAEAVATAKRFEAQIASANSASAEAVARAAEAHRMAESERLERIKIEESVAWRRLTKDQQSKLADRLRPFSGESVLLQYNLNDLEADSFALDLASALQLAKWKVFEPLAVMTMREGPVPLGTNPPLERGVVVVSTRDKASHNASNTVCDELRRLGFDAVVRPQDDPRSNPMVFLIIEHRPEGAQGEAKVREALHRIP
jgi:hypothetical protein